MQPHILLGTTFLRVKILGVYLVPSALPEAPDGRLPWTRQLQLRLPPSAGSVWGRRTQKFAGLYLNPRRLAACDHWQEHRLEPYPCRATNMARMMHPARILISDHKNAQVE